MKRKLGLILAMMVIISGLAFAKEGKDCGASKQQTSTQNSDQKKAKKAKKAKKKTDQQPQQERNGFSIWG